MHLSTSLLVAVGVLLLYAAWTDFKSLEIPNAVTLTVVGLFPLFVLATGMTWQEAVVEHLGVGVLVFVPGLALYITGKIGGGDLKLLTAVVIWLGWPMLSSGLVAITILGSLMCLVLIALRRSGVPLWLQSRGFHSLALTEGKGAPYAVAIAAGFCLVQLVPS